MESKVLFVGQDTCRSIPTLERAGYSVRTYVSLEEMWPALVEDPDTAAVAMAVAWEPFLVPSISAARKGTQVPFILFALPNGPPASADFDLVVPASRPTAEWLAEFDLLLSKCKETRERARESAPGLLQEPADPNLTPSKSPRQRLERRPRQAAPQRDRPHAQSVGNGSSPERPNRAEPSAQLVESIRNSDWGLVSCEERRRLNWCVIQALAHLTQLLFRMARGKLDEASPEEIHALQAEASAVEGDLEILVGQWTAHRAAHGC